MTVELVNSKNEVLERTPMLEETFKSLLVKMSTRILGTPKITSVVNGDYRYYNFGSQKLFYRVRITKD